MHRFGERERKHVILFVENQENCRLTKLGIGRKFFRDDSGRHWWILGGIPGNGLDGWHGIKSNAMEDDRFGDGGTLVVSVWDGLVIDIFAGPLSVLLEKKASLYMAKQGTHEEAYQFNCKKQGGALRIYGKGSSHLFTLNRIGTTDYKPESVKSPAPQHHPNPSAAASDVALPRASGAIHAVITESEGWYVAECLEAAVVTQGPSLDELLANLREALALYFDGEELERAGLSPAPRLVLSYETSAFGFRA